MRNSNYEGYEIGQRGSGEWAEVKSGVFDGEQRQTQFKGMPAALSRKF
jgi:hypothetical protein